MTSATIRLSHYLIKKALRFFIGFYYMLESGNLFCFFMLNCIQNRGGTFSKFCQDVVVADLSRLLVHGVHVLVAKRAAVLVRNEAIAYIEHPSDSTSSCWSLIRWGDIA